MGYDYPPVPLISPPKPHNCRRYEGKVCIVTASTKGIGLAIATRFAEEGGKVVVSSRKKDAVDQVVADLKTRGFEAVGTVCHQAKKEDRKAVIDLALATWGRIDVVVLNAAINPGPANQAALLVPDDVFDKLFETNVKSNFQFIKEVYPHLPKPGGNILLVASSGAYVPMSPMGVYGVSKTALLGMVKLFANDLGREGIRVNGLCPGQTRTYMAEFTWKEPERLAMAEMMTTLGRISDPWEQSGVAAFICSDDASFINGENLVVSGGQIGSRL